MSNVSDFVIENGVLVQYNGPDGDVTIPDGVKSFGWGVFNKTRIGTLTLPASIEECSRLPDVEAVEVSPENPRFTSIDGVFYNKDATILLFSPATKKGTLCIPKTVTMMNIGALNECPNITEFKVDPENEKWQAYEGVLYSKDRKTLVRCPGKKTGLLTIPAEVTWLEYAALNNTDCITGFDVNSGNTAFSSIDGVLFDKSGTTLLKYPSGKEGEYTVHAGTIKIDYGAFKYAKGLTKLTIAENVKEVKGYSAYEGCTRLRHLVMPAELYHGEISEAFALERIDLTGDGGHYFSKDGVVFRRWDNGEIDLYVCPQGYSGAYTVPADVNEISERAFMYCKNLTELRFEGKIPKIPSQTSFYACTNLHIPSEYLQTTDKLPAAWIAVANSFTQEDYQWIAVYQTAKGWKELVEKVAQEFDVVAFFDGMLKILGEAKKIPKAISKNVLDFVLVWSSDLRGEQVRELFNIYETKKCAPALEAMSADSRLRSALSGDTPQTEKANYEDPIEQLIRDNWISSKLVETTQRLIPEGIAYRGTNTICHPDVLTFIVTAYAKQLDDAVKFYSMYKQAYVRATPDAIADQAAAALDPEAFEAFLKTLATDEENLTAGYLLALGRYASPKCISELIARMKEWEQWRYGANGRKAIIIARGGLMLSDTREAMLAVDKVGALDYYAQIRGTSADVLRDTVLSDFGLDQNGKKVCDLGNGHAVEIQLNADLSLGVYDLTSQKAVKSIPKKGADPELHAQVNASFSDMKKNAKRIAKARCDLLLQAFLNGTEFEASAWRNVYLKNPLLRQVAALLIWEQAGSTFTVNEKNTVDYAGNFVSLTDDPIKLAHPMEMELDAVKNWQNYFSSRNLKQMFSQIWEPVFDPASIQKDRYSGCTIPVLTLSKQKKHGIWVEGLGAYSEEFELRMIDCTMDATASDWRYTPGVNDDMYYTFGEFSFSAYTRWTNHIVGWLDRHVILNKIKCDDTSIEDMLQGFTLAQITEFIKTASECTSSNVMAVLLDYQAQHFADFDAMAEFTLEDL